MEQKTVYMLIVLKQVKKSIAFYGSRSISTRAQTRFLSQMNTVNTIMSHFNIILSHKYKYLNLSLYFGCQATLFMFVYTFKHAACTVNPSVFMFSLSTC
jgi:hypothetical protein